MTTVTVYTALCERDPDGWWVVTIKDHPGIFTQARRLDQVEAMVTEVIALVLDVPEGSVGVAVVPKLPPDVDAAIEDYVTARNLLASAAGDAAVATLDAVHHLEDMKLTLRDIGQILGLSFQRVQQLSKGANRHVVSH